jgi:hypothetical protein
MYACEGYFLVHAVRERDFNLYCMCILMIVVDLSIFNDRPCFFFLSSILTASRSVLPTTSAFDFGQAFLQKNTQNSTFYTSPVMNSSTMPQGENEQ